MTRSRLRSAILSNRVVSLRLKIAWGLGDTQFRVSLVVREGSRKLSLDHQQGEVVFQRPFAAEAVFRGEHGGEDLLC